MESQTAPTKSRSVKAFVLGLVIGVVVAAIGAFFYLSRPDSDASTRELATGGFGRLDRESEDVKRSDVVSEVQRLQQLIQHQSAFERLVTLRDATADARPGFLVALFAQADYLPQASQRDEIQAALARQLAQLDPQATLDHIYALPDIRKDRLIGVVFQEWSVDELDESIEYAKGMQTERRRVALEGILRSRIDLSDSARREIATQLGNEQLILDQWAKFRDQESIDDALSEWNNFQKDHGGMIEELSPNQRNLLVNIARIWIVRDGFSDLVQGMNVSLTDYSATVSLIELLLDDLIAADPTLVLEAATGMTDEVRSIVMKALASLAARNPETAFEIAAMMEGSSNQIVLQRAALGAWIEADPKGVLEARDGLPAEFKPWIEQTALMSMVRTLPEEVPPFIPTITDKTQMEIVVINLGLNWARKDPMAVFEWLQSEPEAKPWYGHVLSDVMENLTRQDPQKAMRFALEQPIDDYYEGAGWEVSVVWSIAQTDIDAAVELIDHARDEVTREYMLESIGRQIRNQGQYKRAIDWAENLKEESRNEYYERTVLGWAIGNPEHLYENLDSLPSENIKEYAANMLIGLHESQKAFSEEQIEELRKYLPDEESESQ